MQPRVDWLELLPAKLPDHTHGKFRTKNLLEIVNYARVNYADKEEIVAKLLIKYIGTTSR